MLTAAAAARHTFNNNDYWAYAKHAFALLHSLPHKNRLSKVPFFESPFPTAKFLDTGTLEYNFKIQRLSRMKFRR